MSPEERDLLRRKQCNSINRVAYVCCSGGGSPVTPEPITGSTRGNMGVTSEPSRLRAKLPKAPDCGTSLGDRVSKKGRSSQKALKLFDIKLSLCHKLYGKPPVLFLLMSLQNISIR